MRILHLANHCQRIGNGIMNVAVDLACEQARMGHDLMFASAGGSFVPLLVARGVGHAEVWQHWRRPLAVGKGLVRLRRVIAAFKPDIVHAHMMGGALMARALNIPRRFALVTSVHNEWQRTVVFMSVGDRVIAVSEATRVAMRMRGFTDDQLRAVRNGPIGSPRSTFEPTAAPRLARPALLTVCGLYRRKGVADLIEAFAKIAEKHRAARLYIAGDGPNRELFHNLAAKSGFSDRIEFLGFVENPRPLFEQADVFVLPTHSEPFGLVFAEAREAGCAIIGADVGGVAEVLEQGKAGLLVPPRDTIALAAAMDRMLDSPALRDAYRRRAVENLEWLSCARMASETLEIYRECARTPARDAAPTLRSRHRFSRRRT